MFSVYGRVLSEPGAALFSATGLVARLPMSMFGLGIVFLVEAATGSYGIAGTMSATFIVGEAAAAIALGRLVDRLGQAQVLIPAVLVCSSGTAGVMVVVESGQPLVIAYLLAAVAGAAFPPIGACVRTRWSHLLGTRRPSEPHLKQTAFAVEAVVDELVFIVGPVLITLLATLISPIVGLFTALTLLVVGTLAFAAQRGTQPPAAPRLSTGATASLRMRIIGPATVVGGSLGAMFGATEVATVAFTDELGRPALAGVLLALWSGGSLIAGVVSGALSWGRGPGERLRLGMTAFTVMMAPLPWVSTAVVMGGLLFLAGLTIAPTLIALVALVEQVAHPSRLTESLSVVHTGMAAGIGLGAAVAGPVIDAAGASASYVVTLAVGALGAVAAWVMPREETLAPHATGQPLK